MDVPELKKAYGSLMKKYKLPSWKDLDDEFEIVSREIPPVSDVLRFVRRRISEKIAYYTSVFENLLQPNPGSLISLNESKFFTEAELQNVIHLLKELMYLDRYSLLLDISSIEREEAEYIVTCYKQWLALKKDLARVTQTLREGWKRELKSDRFQYFG
ncbi:MAG: hypothetical protein AABX86_01840 [Nanoarchaeota archaeon]